MQAIKKRIKSIIVLLVCVSNIQVALAQTVPEKLVNDTINDDKIINIISSPGTDTKISNLYKNGLLIINFWATWCVPCVKELTELAQLLDQQETKVNVLCVGYESKLVVTAFLNAHPALKNSKLIFTYNDQQFAKIFPHVALPHNVWVNDQGIVKAITGGEELTSQNIISFLNGVVNPMRVKKEMTWDWQKQPLPVVDSMIEFRSIFKKQVTGINLSIVLSDRSKAGVGHPYFKRFFGVNSRITTLFWNAYQMDGNLIPKNELIEIHTNDSTRYFGPGEGVSISKYHGMSIENWELNNAYSYELITTNPVPEKLFSQHVIGDLELNLGIKSSLELRKMVCTTITYDRQANKLSNGPTDNGKFYLNIVNNQLIIKNVSMDALISWLENREKKPRKKEPYLNKTGIDFPISVTVNLGNDPVSYWNYMHLEKCLEQQLGLVFSNSEQSYPVLVLGD